MTESKNITCNKARNGDRHIDWMIPQIKYGLVSSTNSLANYSSCDDFQEGSIVSVLNGSVTCFTEAAAKSVRGTLTPVEPKGQPHGSALGSQPRHSLRKNLDSSQISEKLPRYNWDQTASPANSAINRSKTLVYDFRDEALQVKGNTRNKQAHYVFAVESCVKTVGKCGGQFNNEMEDTLGKNFKAFQRYIEKCVKPIEMIVFFDKFSLDQRKYLKETMSKSSKKANRKIFDVIKRMDDTPDKYTSLLNACKEGGYPKIAELLTGRLAPKSNKHRNILSKAAKHVYQRLSVCEVTPYLFTKGVINQFDIEMLKTKEVRCEAAIELLLLLPNRNRKWYCLFIEALVESNQCELAELIDKKMTREIKERMNNRSLRSCSLESVCHYPINPCDTRPADSFGTLLQNYTPSSSLSAPSIDDVLHNLPRTETIIASPVVTYPLRSPFKEDSAEEFEIVTDLDNPDSNLVARLTQLSEISNEKGLDAQNFQCKACTRPLGLIFRKSRVCAYDGGYYCFECHVNDEYYIPARIVHIWDFRKHKVAKKNLEFLQDVEEQPHIDIEDANPRLYDHVPEMQEIKKLRTQLIYLKTYLFTCKQSTAEDFKRLLWPRDYLFENVELYSLADLLQVPTGGLAASLRKVIKFATKHVYSCRLCSQKGFICELCNNSKVIYAFEMDATYRCPQCRSVFHKECKTDNRPCPKCQRRLLREASHGLEPTSHDRASQYLHTR